MGENQSLNLRMTVYASLFTALIIIGGYISIPIPLSPVPIVLSDFFVMLTGLFLGARWGITSVGLYIFLGALGLPVFSGGKTGLAHLFGPTGGYLFGFLIAVYVIGYISHKGKASVYKDLAALLAGNLIIYAIGVPWLKEALNLTWDKAFAFGLIPFIPGTIIKIVAAIGLIKALRPSFNQSIANPTEHGE